MKWIINNHKEGIGLDNINDYINKLNNIDTSNINLVICPNNNEIKYFTNQNYQLGSQDISNNQVKYSIIGHHDTRVNNNETDDEINKKMKYCIENNIIPILCIGEDLNTNPKEVIKKQLITDLKDITNTKIIIAYEPNWAINTGVIPNVEELKTIIEFIKEEVNNLKINATILYGGSVNEKTVLELEKLSNLDGYLIGNASLDIEKLKKIIEVIK